MNMRSWQLQEAKNKLSHVIKEARQGKPQIITLHGEQVVVLLSVDEYKRLIKPVNKLSEALSRLELNDNELIFERNTSMVRDVEL